MVDTTELTVGGDDVDRRDVRGLKAVLAADPAKTSAQRVAGNTNVRRRAVHGSEAVVGQRRDHLLPLDASLYAHALGAGIDRHALQVPKINEQGVSEIAVGVGVVAGRLGRDTKPLVASELDRRDDFAAVTRERDRRRSQVERKVENAAGGVPLSVLGKEDLERRASLASDHGAIVAGGKRRDHPASAGNWPVANPCVGGRRRTSVGRDTRGSGV
ncbi:hypothetical protein HRbin41_01417 [bacterium HR41]|nr:hypothetical protein HRbin41_01417 [bacterium HR41]